MPRWAAIATLAMVAPGTVKSRMASALADMVQRAADSSAPLAGRPASAPASLPSSAEAGASSAPVSTAPSVSEMTRVSARPIRPPAPATIKRMSDIFQTSPEKRGTRPCRIAAAGRSGNRLDAQSGSWLRPVIAFDDHEIGFGVGVAERDQADIFRGVVAGDRGLIVLEFDHHIARGRGAFLGHMPAGPHQKPGAVFGKYRAVLRDVLLVAVRVVHIDARDPVALCHLVSLPYQPSAWAISAWMACAAAFGSSASITGRPTTR